MNLHKILSSEHMSTIPGRRDVSSDGIIYDTPADVNTGSSRGNVGDKVPIAAPTLSAAPPPLPAVSAAEHASRCEPIPEAKHQHSIPIASVSPQHLGLCIAPTICI